MKSNWTDALALAHFAHTGWHTWPASLALLALLTVKVLLNATQKAKCLKEVGHLTKSVGHTQSSLVGHLKSCLKSKDLSDINCYFTDLQYIKLLST